MKSNRELISRPFAGLAVPRARRGIARAIRAASALGYSLALLLALSGCHKETSGSLLDPHPGVYKGPPVAALSPAAAAALEKRVRRQEFYNDGGPT